MSKFDLVWNGQGKQPLQDEEQYVKNYWRELLQRIEKEKEKEQPKIRYLLVPLRGREVKSGKKAIRIVECCLDVITLTRHRKVGNAARIPEEFTGVLFTDDPNVIENLERELARCPEAELVGDADDILQKIIGSRMDRLNLAKRLLKSIGISEWRSGRLERAILRRVNQVSSRVKKIEAQHNLSLATLIGRNSDAATAA